MSKSQTNTEFVTELMEYSRCGALIQAFVVEALIDYSKKVIATPEDQFSGGLINPAAWKRCAEEIKTKVEARYGC